MDDPLTRILYMKIKFKKDSLTRWSSGFFLKTDSMIHWHLVPDVHSTSMKSPQSSLSTHYALLFIEQHRGLSLQCPETLASGVETNPDLGTANTISGAQARKWEGKHLGSRDGGRVGLVWEWISTSQRKQLLPKIDHYSFYKKATIPN